MSTYRKILGQATSQIHHRAEFTLNFIRNKIKPDTILFISHFEFPLYQEMKLLSSV